MSLILCIETSSTNCSIALASENGGYSNPFGVQHCLDLIEDNSDGYSHGERLHVFIQDLLKRNHKKTSDLTAIAVSEGPGSYTGLRIGVSTAKGMCYALDIPMLAISTLQSLALQSVVPSKYVIPMLDARRMEVYAAVFSDGIMLRAPEAVVLDVSSFKEYCQNSDPTAQHTQTTFVGTGIEKFKEIIGEDRLAFAKAKPTAITLCDLAIDKFKKSDTVDVAYFEPFYLKEFKAG